MVKGQYKEIVGNICRVTDNETGNIVIPHVCNNIGAYGAGVAKAIRNKWSAAYLYYMKHIDAFKAKDKDCLLGGNSYCFFTENDCQIGIVNMIAQNELVSRTNPRPLHYPSLIKCMEDVVEIASDKFSSDDKKNNFKICTVKFGSALAGGNWDFIKCLIEDIWLSQGIDVTVYVLN